MSKTNQAALEIDQSYVKRANGQSNEIPQWNLCVAVVGFQPSSDKSLKIPAGSMYAKRYFPPKAKAEVVEMIDYIKREFSQVFVLSQKNIHLLQELILNEITNTLLKYIKDINKKKH